MSRPFVIGLTGSVGMGKSTAAAMFRELGIPVWDADAAVHRLYEAGGDGAAEIARIHPPAIVDAAVDRSILRKWIESEPSRLRRIEEAIHPLVAKDRADFISRCDGGTVVVDIPLLFETGQEASVDHIVVVSAPPKVQRARVLARPGMTEEQFQTILAKQMPDAEKRKRADVVLPTETLEDTRQRLYDIVRNLGTGKAHA